MTVELMRLYYLPEKGISKKGSLPVEVGRLFFYIREIIKETEGSVLKKTTQDGGA